MIIDKIEKLYKFLDSKPVKTINKRLDAIASFLTTQVKYAQFMMLGIVSFSAFGLILPYKGNANFYIASSTKDKFIDLGQSQQKSLLGSPVLVKSRVAASNKSNRFDRVLSALYPTREKIQRIPFSIICSYSLNRPEEGIKLRFSLKSWQVHGQKNVFSEKVDDTTIGFFMDKYSVVQPIIPVAARQIYNLSLHDEAKALLNKAQRYWSAFRNGETIIDVSSFAIANNTDNTNNTDDNNEQNNAASTAINLASTSQTHTTEPRFRISKATGKFFRHFLGSVYFKFDWLNTLIFRIEQ